MEISQEKVEKYRATYQRIYGRAIEKGRARGELTALVCLMNAVRNYIGSENREDKNDAKNNKTN